MPQCFLADNTMSIHKTASAPQGAVLLHSRPCKSVTSQNFLTDAQIFADLRFFHHLPVKTGLVEESTCGIEGGHLGMRRRTVGVKADRQMNDGTGAFAMKTGSTGMTRRGLLRAFAATAIVATPTYSNAAGFLRGAGDIRRVHMYSGRTGEKIDMIYWIEGQYIPEALSEITYFMRDWRTGTTRGIDTRTIDIVTAAHALMDTSEPYMLLSGYRSPQTNAMLRQTSSGVARNSLHIQGQANDLRLSSRSVNQMARAAMSCAAGGVGVYSNSNFVHMDCGSVRSWGG
jgi:uncharacterized protein YcbK (DUF882 family)